MKQECKNKIVSVPVQNVIESNRTTNVNITNVATVEKTKSVVATVQQNLVNWKWVVIDQIKFKDFPIPCIIRDNDPIKEYVSVRIIETVILSKFESCLSDEAKKFGLLAKYPCTSGEINTLNDINQNHVDKLYGKEIFEYETDFLVSLEQFMKFYKIIERTVPLRINSNENILKKIPHIDNGPLIQKAHNQNFVQINNLRSNANSFKQLVPNYRLSFNEPMMHRLPNYSHYNICNTNSNSYQNNHNQFFNYAHSNILNHHLINKIHSNQINPIQHQVFHLLSSTSRPYLAPNSNQITNKINQNATKCVNNNNCNSIDICNSNKNNNSNSYINNSDQINHNLIQTNIQQQNTSTITIPMASTTIRNLTPPLTPLTSSYMISSQANNVNNSAKIYNEKINSNQIAKNDENDKKNKHLDTSSDICLIDDSDEMNKISQDQNRIQNENAIDFNDETYGFLQVNDKILLYIDVEDAFYRYNRYLPKCKKHVLLIHLVTHLNINCELNLRKNLKIKIIENNVRIKNLIKWFNQNRAPMSLDLIADTKIELVNIMQFQNVYAKEAIFFKNLYYFNQPGIDYCAEYKKILSLQGGFVYVPIDNKRNIRPFVHLNDKRLVSCNLTDLICKSIDSEESQIESEKISFDLRTDSKLLEEINELYLLLTFYFSLNTARDFRKKNTLFFNLNKWLFSFPNNFKILCEFNSKFPKTWLNDLDKMENQNRTTLVNSDKSAFTQTNDQNDVDETDEDESVYMSPQSDNQPIETISIAILNEKNSNEFSQEDLSHKPRLRSYSETSVLLKFSDKYKNKNKQLIKYKYLYKRRNSCTALQFLKNDQTVNKNDMIKNQLVNFMDNIIEKKHIGKKISKKKTNTFKNDKSNFLIKEEKNEPILTQIESCQVESSTYEPTIESLAEELKIKKSKPLSLNAERPFLIDSSSSSSLSIKFNEKKKQLKRKKTKIEDNLAKRARLIFGDKKNTNFQLPDYRNISLTTDDFISSKRDRFPRKSTQFKNILMIQQNQNDLYSNDLSKDDKYFIKKYNLFENLKVIVEKIDISEYFKKIVEIENEKKKSLKQNKKSDKSFTTLKIDKISNFSSIISLNDAEKKPTVDDIINTINSDDEDELPRLDLDFIKP